MLIGGLDVGTTGCKLSVYDDKGNFVANSYKEYEVSRRSGAHEVDAAIIFDAVCEVIRNIAAEHDVEAIGVTTFGEAFTMLDENDNVLIPSMLYTDPRGEEEVKELCNKLGEERIISIAGLKPHQMYSLPKVMWVKKNLPDVYAKVKRILLIEDYIVYKLSGVRQMNYSLAARTMALDIRNKCWSKEILDAAGVDEALFSNLVPAGTLAGNVLPEVAEKLGLKADVKIVNSAHDQVASAVGCGVFEAGQAVDGTGTVECVTPVFDSVPENKALYEDGYSVVPHVFDGTYVCYAVSYTGGAAIKWFRDNLSVEKSYAKLDASVGEKPTGILVMPHFAGAANPYMDIDSKAAIIGLGIEHSGADMYKAMMEGVTYEMMLNLEHLGNCGINPKKLYATGGGATSKVWMQIKADILNRPMTSVAAKEVGACGTCMLVGVAIGLYKDLYEAKEIFVKEDKTVMPNAENAEIYKKYFNAYKQIYSAVRPIVKEIQK